MREGNAAVADKPEVERIVCAVLKDVFGADRIGDVHVVRALGWDDDEILRIYVAFDDWKGQFDAGLASGVVRHMRPRLLAELAEEAFPVISYISSADMKTVKNAVG